MEDIKKRFVPLEEGGSPPVKVVEDESRLFDVKLVDQVEYQVASSHRYLRVSSCMLPTSGDEHINRYMGCVSSCVNADIHAYQEVRGVQRRGRWVQRARNR